MGLTFELSPPFLRIVTQGDVAYEDGLAQLKRAIVSATQHDPQPADGWDVVFDVTQSGENRSSGELREIADTVCRARPILSGRCALVAGDPLHFGLSRMFGTYLEGAGFTAEVFASRAEAEEWIRSARKLSPDAGRSQPTDQC